MSTSSPLYGSASTLAMGADGLTNGSAYQSASIHLAGLWTPSADDISAMFDFKTGSGSLGSNPLVNVYVGGGLDATNYPDGLTGTAGSYTMPANPTNLQLWRVISYTAAAATPVQAFKASLAVCFGGFLPPYMVIVVQNSTGLTLSGTGGGSTVNTCTIMPLNETIA